MVPGHVGPTHFLPIQKEDSAVVNDVPVAGPEESTAWSKLNLARK